jgi:hypothetical protein
MAIDLLMRVEMVAAISVSCGALVTGAIAILSEIRRPGRRRAPPEAAPVADDLLEEFDRIDRSLWLVERRLSDRLVMIEAYMAAASAISQSRAAAASGSISPSDESSQ